MSSPPPHDIPADIFYEILLQYGVKNLAFLWLNCRPVSHNFKNAVERVFVAKHLRKTWLHVNIRELQRDIELQFYRLDAADPTRAVFESSAYQGLLERALKKGPSLSNVIIQIRHDANDTTLPEFRYHFNPDPAVKFEVSFDWKGMYCHFFREQKEVERRCDIAMARATQALASVITCGPMPVSIDRKKIARHVRLERIKRCMWEVESQEGRGVFWHARSGFGTLERRQHWAMLEGPDSDESDADEDEDEDEDEENEDEDGDESENEDDTSEEASSEEDDE
ncbi:hypothetical protein EV421DRAFT_1903134 [Armillaria borealis]|uniref:Uncharacterized protein n=1 Tax=Armillaria borealis TaxID=47425 RepID=A0AA39JJN6_9AGAR|nr:hypothetical protein EV421DRAFT_1903134 [Armillaria borealis]